MRCPHPSSQALLPTPGRPSPRIPAPACLDPGPSYEAALRRDTPLTALSIQHPNRTVDGYLVLVLLHLMALELNFFRKVRQKDRACAFLFPAYILPNYPPKILHPFTLWSLSPFLVSQGVGWFFLSSAGSRFYSNETSSRPILFKNSCWVCLP